MLELYVRKENERNTSVQLIKETLIPRHCFKLDPVLLEEGEKLKEEELMGPYTSQYTEMQALFFTALRGRNVHISVGDLKLKAAG